MKSRVVSPSTLRITVRFLLVTAAAVTITLIGFEVMIQVLTLSESMLARHGVNGLNIGLIGICLTVMGALLGCVGVFASPFLRNGTGEPQWLLYVYACSFFAGGLFLLMHWFAVCGATGFQL
jgi:protein-S-isoprenylcysteine O-methyltransferase Ste14